MLLSSAIVDFHLLHDGHVQFEISAGLTRSRCRISGTEVSLKAIWPLETLKLLNILTQYILINWS